MSSTLFVPLWFIALGAAHFMGNHFLFILWSSLGTAHLSYLMAQDVQNEPELNTGAETIEAFTLQDLEMDAAGNEFMPLYIGGIKDGLNPVTDWYVARVDHQQVIILEHVKGATI